MAHPVPFRVSPSVGQRACPEDGTVSGPTAEIAQHTVRPAPVEPRLLLGRSGRWPAVRLLAAGLGLGALAGTLWGAALRGFMRVVSTDPEFSWSGTMFIVVLFTLFGAAQGLAGAARRGGIRRRWLTVYRGFGVLTTLLILAGPGALLTPTVLGGGLAVHRSDWRVRVRVVVGLAGLAAFLAVAIMIWSDMGVGWRSIGGVVLLGVLYLGIVGAVGATLRPQGDGWHLAGRWRVAGIVLVAGIACLGGVSLVGVGG